MLHPTNMATLFSQFPPRLNVQLKCRRVTPCMLKLSAHGILELVSYLFLAQSKLGKTFYLKYTSFSKGFTECPKF